MNSANNVEFAGRDIYNKTSTLFEDDESDADVNFEIKTQFEGKRGQKVKAIHNIYLGYL